MQPGQDPPKSAFHTDREYPQGSRWSARTTRLLDAIFRLCTERLRGPLHACLSQFEQQQLLTSREQVLRQHVPIETRYFAEIKHKFERIDSVPARVADATGNTWHELTLVDPDEQELATTLDQIGTRGESFHSDVLRDLSYRVAVLVAAPPLEGESLPLSPQSLIQAFHAASLPLQLPLREQLQLLRTFDRNLIRTLAPVYEAVNSALCSDGIMPQLHNAPVLRHLAGRLPAPEAEPEASAETASLPQDVPVPASVPASTPASASAPIDVLESLRNLLAQHRMANAAGKAPIKVERAASTEELQTALSALQEHLTQVTDKASRELRSAARLHEELITQLNAGKSDEAPRTQLTSEQGDTVELVATLFEQLAGQLHRGGSARSLLGGLQVPVLRMAVSDRSFFEKRTHPARQLLDTVATAADEWLDGTDDDTNRLLASKLEQLVARASGEPPSSSLYTVLLADIEYQIGLLNRKAKAAERRHIEAAQGRERLDQARQRASELMAGRFADSPPRGLLRALLDRAWSDVLAITLLRHGEDSDAFAEQLAITDQLLGRLAIADRAQLQHDVEAGLQQIGMHTEEALQVAERLLGVPDRSTGPLQPSTPDLAQRLEQRQRLGEAAGTEVPPPGPLVASDAKVEPTDPREKTIAEHLCQLPFGTWFEFDGVDDGAPARRKLAWYSPMSGRCLLLTRRGQRAGEATLAELAHEIAHNRVREAPIERGSLLDRAWRSLTAILHQPPALQVASQGAHQ